MLKKSIIVFAAFITVLTSSSGKASGTVKSGYEYTIIDGEVTVTGYEGEPEYIDIPEFIEGCPVTEIRDNAFFNCHSLKEAVLPDTVLKIGHHSFYACYELERIKLPSELEEIGMGCFCGCAGLKDITIPETLDVLTDSCFRACASLEQVKLPRRLKIIEKYCFAGCDGLKSVDIGEEVAAIGERAFYMCGRMNCAVIPLSCESIGKQAFGYSCDLDKMPVKTDMVMIGNKNSAAEMYAAENEIDFAENTEAAAAFSQMSGIEKKKTVPEWIGYAGVLVFGILIAIVIVAFFNEIMSKKLK